MIGDDHLRTDLRRVAAHERHFFEPAYVIRVRMRDEQISYGRDGRMIGVHRVGTDGSAVDEHVIFAFYDQHVVLKILFCKGASRPDKKEAEAAVARKFDCLLKLFDFHDRPHIFILYTVNEIKTICPPKII